MRASGLTRHLGVGVFLLGMIAGCGNTPGLERVSVSGRVTLNDVPIQDGQIRFVAEEGTKAPITIEHVKDGRYDTESSGGVPVGNFQVEILSYNPAENLQTGPGMPPRNQLLPAKFNTKSELKLVVESGQGSLVRDFLLKP